MTGWYARVGLHKPDRPENRGQCGYAHWWVDERDGVIRCLDCGVKR